MKSEPDIIVIGAGAAGMAAAGALAKEGWPVRVLEARDRVGGRVFSARPAGWHRAVELGAEFVHGGNRALMAAIKGIGAKTRKLRPNIWYAEKGGLALMPDYWERIGRVADRIPRRDHGWSFRQFLWHQCREVPADDRKLAEAYVSSFNAAPADRISAHALRENHAGADTEDLKLMGAYAAVMRGLQKQWPARSVDLRLKTIAWEIRWQRGEVAVTTRDAGDGKIERHRARAVVITLPLGVLKAGRVKFSPPLAARQQLIDRAGWGHVIRIMIRFRKGFWSAPLMPPALGADQGRGFGFVNAPKESVPVWWALTAPEPVLTGWVSGEAFERIKRKPARAIFDEAVKSLARIFRAGPDEVRRWIADSVWHDWRRDPFALGAYSFPVAGADDLAERLSEPVDGTLFFAGEALAADFGTVHGAIDSGLHAARWASDQLKAASDLHRKARVSFIGTAERRR